MKDLRTRLLAAGYSVEGEPEYSCIRPEILEGVEYYEVDNRIMYTQYWNVLSMSMILDSETMEPIMDFDHSDFVWNRYDLMLLTYEAVKNLNPKAGLESKFGTFTTEDDSLILGDPVRVGPFTGRLVSKDVHEDTTDYIMLLEGNSYYEER